MERCKNIYLVPGTDGLHCSTALTVSPHEGRQKQPSHHAQEAEAEDEQPETPGAVCGVEGDESRNKAVNVVAASLFEMLNPSSSTINSTT